MIWCMLITTVRLCLSDNGEIVGEEPPVATEIRSTGGNTELVLTMKTALNTTGYGILMRTWYNTRSTCLQESTMSMLKTTRVVL